MSSRAKYTILLVSSLVVVYAIIGGMMGRVSAQDGSYRQLSTFMEVIERIRNDYVDEPSLNVALEGAIRGMVERVDPYGGYLTPDRVDFYTEFDPLAAAGIGVTLAKRFDFPVIVAAVPGGPADQAGLGAGDVIEGISNESLREHNLVEVYQLLSGNPGTQVELNVIRRNQPAPETHRLIRQVVSIPAVEARILEQSVGYIRIPVLASGKAFETSQQIDRLTAEGATRILLDLRNSAGGSREEAVELADLFIDSGLLGYVEGQTVERETFSATPGTQAAGLPLAVLINEGTADAAEIVAAAIRDNGRGELVGVQTFGLGSVQKLLPLDDGSALLLSIASYYTPNGTEIRREGIRPTVEVSETEPADPLATRPLAEQGQPGDADRQLDRALEILLDDTAVGTAA